MSILRHFILASLSITFCAAGAFSQDQYEDEISRDRDDNKPRFFCQCEVSGLAIRQPYQGRLYQVLNGKVTSLKSITTEFNTGSSAENLAACNAAIQAQSICN